MRVVTFYSYKGGVGRSFAVANAAVILAQWGVRVLMVDWDIEAPGLSHYFAPFGPKLSSGVLDFLDDCRQGHTRPSKDYASPIQIPDCPTRVHLMPAAAGGGTDYTARVQHIDWDALYDRHQLGRHLERLRTDWEREFDLVLVDSRTGVTDFSGLTTAQLPDVLAFLFTANRQSLEGCADIARRAMAARTRMPLDRPALLPLPIPARFEQREEYERAREWRYRFVTHLEGFLDFWKPRHTDSLKLIDLLTIPYVPRWTFGEELAALEEPAGSSGTRTPGQAVSYALETISALLVCGFSKVELLVSSRDEYVHGARVVVQGWRSGERDKARVFISYAWNDKGAVDNISRLLSGAGFDIQIQQDPNLAVESESTRDDLENSDAYVVLVGDRFSSEQELEVESIIRNTLRSDKRKPIVPLVLPRGEKQLKVSRLADFAAIRIDPDRELEVDQFSPVLDRLSSLLKPI